MKNYLPILTLLFVFISGVVFPQQIVINEFMSSNDTTLQDSDGDYPDWIELYNAGENTINLNGFMITDDTLVPDKWIFPEQHLLPQSFLVIFASGKDRYDTLELHTNFKIKSSGEYLLLSYPDTTRADCIAPVGLPSDRVYGRYPDGSTNMAMLAYPTPYGANAPAASTLAFSEEAGVYVSPLKVAILSENANDIIYYTLDGSVPGPGSFIYNDSICINNINNEPNHFADIPTSSELITDEFRKWSPPDGPVPKATVLRAVAYRDGNPVSRVMTNTYFVDPDFFERYPYHIVSLATDSVNLFGYDTGIYVPGVHFDPDNANWTGNYYQKGSAWERPAYFEYFENNGQRALDLDCGIRIHGKITRHGAQKTLRLYSNSDENNGYFHYPFMMNTDQDVFKRLLLRTIYADGSQTMIKDAMLQDLVKDFDLEMMHYRPVNVFINGEYWGIQTIRERIDKYYIALLYDIDPNNIDLLENNMSVIEGSADDYQEMISYIEENDLSEEPHYEYIETQMDIDNYIDYMITEIYFQNMDWPGSNIRYWRERKPDAKWRWILFDLDNTCFDYNFNSLEYATFEGDTSWQNPPWSTFLFRNLLKSEEFEEEFLERFAHHLNTRFQTDTLLNQIDAFTELYGKGLDLQMQRWNFPRSYVGWINDIDYVFKKFAIYRPCKMRDFILEYFGLDEDEFGFTCDSSIHDGETKKPFLFPNPASKKVWIDIKDWKTDTAFVQIFDPNGKLIWHQSISVLNGNIHYAVNVSELNNGIYIFKVFSEQHSTTSKFLKSTW